MSGVTQPPIAPRIATSLNLHGIERRDDYAWLREKDAADVLAYLEAENAYTQAFMGPTEPLQASLYEEMLGRIQEDDRTVPYKRGAWLYSSRTEKGLQYPILCRSRDLPGASEEVILDLNEIGRKHLFVGVGFHAVSDSGDLLAYGLDVTGFRQYELVIKDLRTGTELPERFARVTSAAFTRDGAGVFYVIEDEVSKRSYRLYAHVLGTDPANDALVYEESDERFDLDIERSRSGEYLILTAASKTSSEVRVAPASDVATHWALVAAREPDHEYYLDHGGERFFVRTNSGGRNFRLCGAPVDRPDRSRWKEIVPHREDVMLEGVMAFAGHLALLELEDGLRRVTLIDYDGGGARRVEFPDPVYALADGPNHDFHAATLRLSYESPVMPPTTYDYDVASDSLVLRKRIEVLGEFDPTAYQVIRVFAPAEDGARIPISVAFRKDARRADGNPLLLYGYGSYGYSLPDTFSSNRISLLDRGMVFAIAHIRGGGEMGKAWHEQGRMLAKLNTFTDFIGSAEFLVREGFTSSDRLVIAGGSAGGLLMGAVTNMRPELFRLVVSHVPFVDVINTMLDESLPLTVGEFEEWGNPKRKDHYEYMVSYSPYDNIEPKPYPTILVMTSYNDSQVMYWEPAKYVAKLRALKTDANPLLLKINMEPAGHGGQSGRYNQLREVAFEYAFILRQLGLA